MATDHTNAEYTPIDHLPSLPGTTGWRDRVPTSRMATAAAAVAYAVAYGCLLVGGGLAIISLASILGGVAGLLMFGTVGLAVMIAAPLAARLLVPGVSAGRTLDRRDDQPPKRLP